MPYPQCYFTPGIEAQRKKLARFVLESDERVHGVAQAAQDKLPEGGFGAYLSGDHARTRVEVQALYEALQAWRGGARERPLCYEADPIETRATDAGVRQRVRLAPEVFATTTGTCLDLALVLAACLYYKRIYPVIVVTRAHAFVGYWKTEHFYEQHWSAPGAMGQNPWPPVIDAKSFKQRFKQGHLGLVDAMGVGRGGAGSGDESVSFDDAEDRVEDHLEGVWFAVDIHAARTAGLSALDVKAPLPAENEVLFPQRAEFERDYRFIRRPGWTQLVDAFLASHRHSGGYLLLVAGEGEGKSRFIADRVRMGDTPYHFVRHKQHNWDDPVEMLRSLRWQLWEKHGIDASSPFAHEVFPTGKGGHNAHARVFADQLERLSAVLQRTGESELLYVDGLDEAFDATGRYHGTPGLPGVLPQALPKGICAVLTSRPGEHLVWLEQQDACTVRELKTPASLEANIEDVKAYFKNYGAELAPPLDADYIDRAARRIEGNFYIARLKLNEMLENPDERPDPDEFSTTVSDLHGQTLLRIERKADEEAKKRRWNVDVVTILGWVALAPAPISVEQLEAFGAPPESREILGWAGGFFAPTKLVRGAHATYRFDPEPASPIGFDHASARQWLTNRLTPGERRTLRNKLADGLAQWGDYLDKDMKAIRRYAVAHLPAMLLETGRTPQLADTLLNYRYLAAAMGADGQSGAASPISPERLARLYEQVGASAELEGSKAEAITLIGQALDLSMAVVREDAAQLPSQLLGRLRPDMNAHIDAFRDAIVRETRGVWLMPMTPTLTAAGGAEIRRLIGHTGAVTHLVLHPDGRRVMSASDDHTVRVWDIDRGVCEAKLARHTDEVTRLVLHPDGRRVVSASGDGMLRVWNINCGVCEATLKGHTRGVTQLVLHPDGRRVVSSGTDDTLRVWDIDLGACVATLDGHAGGVFRHLLHPDRRRVVSGSSDGTLRVWDIDLGACEATLDGHTDGVTQLVLHPDGRRMVSASWDSTLRVWDINYGLCEATFEGHTAAIVHVALHPHGTQAVSASADNTLRVWDLEHSSCLRTLTGHTGCVNHVAYSDDGLLVVSSSEDKTLRVWDTTTWDCIAKLEGHVDSVTQGAILGEGRLILSASQDSSLRVWRLDGVEQGPRRYHEDGIDCLGISLDGQCILSGASSVSVWSARDLRIISSLPGHEWPMHDLDIDQYGTLAVSSSTVGVVRLWDLQRNQCRVLMRGPPSYIHVLLSPDGRWAAAASSRHSAIAIWDVRKVLLERWNKFSQEFSYLPTMFLEGHTDAVSCIAMYARGSSLVSGSADGRIRFWALDRKCSVERDEHTDAVMHFAVSEKSRIAVSASMDGTLRVWCLDNQSCRMMLRGHEAGVEHVAITSNGRVAVSASQDHTVRVWDLTTAKCLGLLEGHTDSVRRVALTRDSRYGISAGLDGTMRVWDLESMRCTFRFWGDADLTALALGPRDDLIVAGDKLGNIHFLRLVLG